MYARMSLCCRDRALHTLICLSLLLRNVISSVFPPVCSSHSLRVFRQSRAWDAVIIGSATTSSSEPSSYSGLTSPVMIWSSSSYRGGRDRSIVRLLELFLKLEVWGSWPQFALLPQCGLLRGCNWSTRGHIYGSITSVVRTLYGSSLKELRISL